MRHFDIIKDAINFNYDSLGCVELRFVSIKTGLHEHIIKSVLTQLGFIESRIRGQYIKEKNK